MLEFFPFKRTIPFMSWGKVTTAISLLTFLFCGLGAVGSRA